MIRLLLLRVLLATACCGGALSERAFAGSSAHPAPTTAAPAHPAPAATATPVAKEAAHPAAPAAAHNEEITGLLKLANSLTDRGGYDSAEVAFHQALNADDITEEELKSALLGLARMHRKQGALTKAVAIYERYLKDYPGDERSPDVLLNLGRALRDLGIHRMAITRFYSVLNSTLKIDSAHFERYQLLAKTAQFEIAQTHFEAGSFAEAGRFFTRLRLLDLAPADRARAHFMSACALRLQGDREVAVTTLRAYIDQNPDDENIPEARYLLAVTLHELKRTQESFTATLELLRAEKSRTAADPKRWAYWQRRTGNQLANVFFENGDTLNAHAIYSGLRELSTEPQWRLPLTYQIALCYERLGVLNRAQAAYQSIIDDGGAKPAPELAELVRMAEWRIKHLAWRERVDGQISGIFTPPAGTRKDAAATPPPPAAGATPLTP